MITHTSLSRRDSHLFRILRVRACVCVCETTRTILFLLHISTMRCDALRRYPCLCVCALGARTSCNMHVSEKFISRKYRRRRDAARDERRPTYLILGSRWRNATGRHRQTRRRRRRRRACEITSRRRCRRRHRAVMCVNMPTCVCVCVCVADEFVVNTLRRPPTTSLMRVFSYVGQGKWVRRCRRRAPSMSSSPSAYSNCVPMRRPAQHSGAKCCQKKAIRSNNVCLIESIYPSGRNSLNPRTWTRVSTSPPSPLLPSS